jgi:hypothetical protein
VRQIAIDGHPILRVNHDIEDGGWQFLEWGTPSMKDAMLVCLKNVVASDPTILELADLPLVGESYDERRLTHGNGSRIPPAIVVQTNSEKARERASEFVSRSTYPVVNDGANIAEKGS